MPGPETTEDVQAQSIEAVAKRARAASRAMLSLKRDQKDDALQAIHDELAKHKEQILQANNEDKMAATERLSQGEISGALVKRLELGGRKFDGMLTGVLSVKSLEDPVGKCLLSREIDTDLQLYRVACPIGVIAVIFEARPEAAVQIASLAIKSSNAVILKGGREAQNSNQILVDSIRNALSTIDGFPIDAVQLVSTREQVRQLLDQSSYIDLIIPRGSNQLVTYITQNTRIPVMGHADGICSVYIDEHTTNMSTQTAELVVDSKAQYPAVCNAAETLLVHRHVLSSVLPTVGFALAKAGVTVRCDHESHKILSQIEGLSVMQVNEKEDYDMEFLDLIMAVKTVDSLQQAIDHINEHGSGHTDAIITENHHVAQQFLTLVDSASVYHNASTRFADGFRLGFGAEVGVSTHRTHARGPVGLEGLMIYKYKMFGKGHTVAPYADGTKSFTHKDTPEILPPTM